jgi:amino acid transporter
MNGEVSAGAGSTSADDHESRRLSVFALVGLAAGGLIGSGWFSSSANAEYYTHGDAVWAWIFAGAIMLAVAIVMVELSIFAPTTGGLIFSPLQRCGPLVATIAAAAFWLAYALNSAAEADFMAQEVGHWTDGTPNLWITVGFMVVILLINLLAPYVFVKLNLGLTIWKIVVPVLVIPLLWFQPYNGKNPLACVSESPSGSPGLLTAAISAGIIFAYIGYQAPIDFAGNVREQGIGAATRLRLAVYLTVIGSIVLYALLQVVFNHSVYSVYQNCVTGRTAGESPFIQYASHIRWSWFAYILRIDAIVSPLGAGIVYSHALTREIAALGRAGLTTRGLQTKRQASIPLPKPLHVYWAILFVNLVVGFIALVASHQQWVNLTRANSVLNLFAYTISCIVLIAILPQQGECGPVRRFCYEIAARLGWAGVALVFYWSVRGPLLWSMGELAVGCALLLGLPLVAQLDLPWAAGRPLRRYDAEAHAKLLLSPGGRLAFCSVAMLGLPLLARLGLPGTRRALRRYRDRKCEILKTDSGARSWYAVVAALELAGFLAILTLLNYLRDNSAVAGVELSIVVVVIALAVFQLIVIASRGYINADPRISREAGTASASASAQEATTAVE